MADKLSWNEIKRTYPDEWVVLVESTFNENDDPVEGVVYDHGPDQAEVYSRCRSGPSHTTVLYTGKIQGGLIGCYVDDLDKED
jgi:hypothetical protein